MSSLATDFIPIPLHERIQDSTEITDKNLLNETDYPQEFTDWFNSNRAEINKVYSENPLLMAEFTLKEFAFEIRAEMD